MKSIFLYMICLFVIMLGTGCQKTEKLHCNKTETSSENLQMKESLNITFYGNQVTFMSIYSEIQVTGDFVKYIDDFSNSLKSQYGNLEGKKGVTYKTDQNDSILSVSIDADLKEMDDEAKAELSILSVKQSLNDVKVELEAEGYSCN